MKTQFDIRETRADLRAERQRIERADAAATHEAMLRERIKEIVDAAPPLSESQLRRVGLIGGQG